jgi:hypothetical protein
VHLVGAHLALGALHQLGDLLGVGVGAWTLALPPAPIAARCFSLFDVVGDRLVIAADQLRRSPQRADQVICLQDLHHFLRSFQPDASSLACRTGQP